MDILRLINDGKSAPNLFWPPTFFWFILLDYLRHAPCMRRVQAGYERCADDYQIRIKSLNQNQADVTEEDGEENVQLLCCSFQEYLHCSERVVNSTCGHETARFTKSFLDRMSGPLIQVEQKKKPHKYTCFIEQWLISRRNSLFSYITEVKHFDLSFFSVG